MAEGVLAGRHALVTGGAQGLGAGMAQALAAAGAKVMIGDLQDDLAARDGRGDRWRGSRRTSTSPTRRAGRPRSRATVEQLGGLDILVNNAGIEISGLIVDAEAADLSKMLEVNVLGTALGHQARAAGDAPRRRGRQGRRDRQRLLGRGDDRLPRASPATPRPSPRSTASPASPRSRPASSASASGSTASTPAWSRRRWACSSPSTWPRSASSRAPTRPSARSSSRPRSGASARSPTWPTRSSSSPPTRRRFITGVGLPVDGGMGM